MYEQDGPKWREKCAEMGVPWAKAQLEYLDPGITVHIRQWLYEKEREEAAESTEQSRRFAQDAIGAARESALASKSAAKWTMIAALISCVGVIVTVLSH